MALVYGVLGLVAIRDHPRDESMEEVLVALDEIVEGIERAGARLLEEDQVATPDRVVYGFR